MGILIVAAVATALGVLLILLIARRPPGSPAPPRELARGRARHPDRLGGRRRAWRAGPQAHAAGVRSAEDLNKTKPPAGSVGRPPGMGSPAGSYWSNAMTCRREACQSAVGSYWNDIGVRN